MPRKIYIKVRPSAGENKVEPQDEGAYKVSVKEPAEKGRSNRAVIKLLADYFKLPQFKVQISAGHTSRSKIVSLLD